MAESDTEPKRKRYSLHEFFVIQDNIPPNLEIPYQESQSTLSIANLSQIPDDLLDDSVKIFPSISLLPGDIAYSKMDRPVRPVLKNYPKTVFGKQNRSFSAKLFEKYDFIEYSISADAVFCNPCRLFGPKYGYGDPSFTIRGFKNWKKSEHIEKHQQSKFHRDSLQTRELHKLCQVTGSVDEQIKSLHRKDVLENREYIKSLARFVFYCGRQNIPLRGHFEGGNPSYPTQNKGNFLELVELIKIESVEFKQRLNSMSENSTYLSPDSQNALIESANRAMLEIINKEVNEAEFYAIIIDGCTDIVTDNLSVCLRYYNRHSFTVCERFVGFRELNYDGLDAQSILNTVESVLWQPHRQFFLKLSNCIGQSTDGASVMSGKKGGFQKLLRDACQNPCIYTHCYAHRLNLVLSSAASSVSAANALFVTLNKIDSFINGSCKRKGIFMECQKQQELQCIILPGMCQHKWNFRERLVDVVYTRYRSILETLEVITDNGRSEEKSEAEGILKKCLNPTFICSLIVFSDIFSQITPLSNAFQSHQADLPSTISLAKEHITVLENKRNEEYFTKMWSVIQTFAMSMDVRMDIPKRRTKKMPVYLKDYFLNTVDEIDSPDTSYSQEIDFFRDTVFYPIIDRIISEMNNRFNDSVSSPLMPGILSCLPTSKDFLHYDSLKFLAESYKIPSDSLQSEIEVCRNIIHSIHQKPDSILSLMEILQPSVGFPSLQRILQLVLTLPIANVSSERSFSSLRNLRTFLRSSTSEDRLSGLALLNIERELAFEINLDRVVDIFSTFPTLREAQKSFLTDENRRKIHL